MSNAGIADFYASFNNRFPQGKAGVVLQGQWRDRPMKQLCIVCGKPLADDAAICVECGEDMGIDLEEWEEES